MRRRTKQKTIVREDVEKIARRQRKEPAYHESAHVVARSRRQIGVGASCR